MDATIAYSYAITFKLCSVQCFYFKRPKIARSSNVLSSLKNFLCGYYINHALDVQCIISFLFISVIITFNALKEKGSYFFLKQAFSLEHFVFQTNYWK